MKTFDHETQDMTGYPFRIGSRIHRINHPYEYSFILKSYNPCDIGRRRRICPNCLSNGIIMNNLYCIGCKDDLPCWREELI